MGKGTGETNTKSLAVLSRLEHTYLASKERTRKGHSKEAPASFRGMRYAQPTERGSRLHLLCVASSHRTGPTWRGGGGLQRRRLAAFVVYLVVGEVVRVRLEPSLLPLAGLGLLLKVACQSGWHRETHTDPDTDAAKGTGDRMGERGGATYVREKSYAKILGLHGTHGAHFYATGGRALRHTLVPPCCCRG